MAFVEKHVFNINLLLYTYNWKYSNNFPLVVDYQRELLTQYIEGVRIRLYEIGQRAVLVRFHFISYLKRYKTVLIRNC